MICFTFVKHLKHLQDDVDRCFNVWHTWIHSYPPEANSSLLKDQNLEDEFPFWCKKLRFTECNPFLWTPTPWNMIKHEGFTLKPQISKKYRLCVQGGSINNPYKWSYFTPLTAGKGPPCSPRQRLCQTEERMYGLVIDNLVTWLALRRMGIPNLFLPMFCGPYDFQKMFPKIPIGWFQLHIWYTWRMGSHLVGHVGGNHPNLEAMFMAIWKGHTNNPILRGLKWSWY